MLGDLNLAEPRALIGFAGPRVIEQTVRETLPEGFQRSEFLLEHGAIDMIVDRRDMRDRIAALLALLTRQPRPRPRRSRPDDGAPVRFDGLAGVARLAAAGCIRSRSSPVSSGWRASLTRTRLVAATLPGDHGRWHERQGVVRRVRSRRCCAPAATAPAPSLRRTWSTTASASVSQGADVGDAR